MKWKVYSMLELKNWRVIFWSFYCWKGTSFLFGIFSTVFLRFIQSCPFFYLLSLIICIFPFNEKFWFDILSFLMIFFTMHFIEQMIDVFGVIFQFCLVFGFEWNLEHIRRRDNIIFLWMYWFLLFNRLLLFFQTKRTLIIFELQFKTEIRTYIRFDFFHMCDCTVKSGVVLFHVISYYQRRWLRLIKWFTRDIPAPQWTKTAPLFKSKFNQGLLSSMVRKES